MQQEEKDNRLWDYIDGLCTADEAKEIALLIAGNDDWKLRYETLLQLHLQLQQTEPAHPSMRFTQNIMDEIAMLPAPGKIKVKVNTKAIRVIAIAAFAASLLILVYSFIRLDWLTTSTTTHHLTEDFQINKSSIHLLILINIVFLLLLIERLVVRARSGSISKH